VTRDPDALDQVRHLARGLAALSSVTCRPGCLARNVGRPIEGLEAGNDVVPCPSDPGLSFRHDVSRDQMAGVVLGWACIAKFVDDPDLQALAAEQTAAIARRLRDDGMWIRDYRGEKTKYGELRSDVEYLPFRDNGALAAIGLAPFMVAVRLNPGQVDLAKARFDLHREGFLEALPEQNTELIGLVNASNVNMVNLALLSLHLHGDANTAHRARRGMRELRNATVGWWNAGFCACYLLGGLHDDRAALVGEVRATLHAMSEIEIPPAQSQRWDTGRVATVVERGISDWAWKVNVRTADWAPAGAQPHPTLTYTPADWLFAYWLARAAGELTPRFGPGALPTAAAVPVARPPWIDAPSPMSRAAGPGG
jgi:hypothetical protein